jgi:hypothetical protein
MTMARGRMPFLACSLAVALGAAACSGGGDSGGGGTTLDVSPTSLSFAADQGRGVPQPQQVQVTFSSPDAVYVGAGFVDAEPSWASVALSGTGTSGTLTVSITSTSLPPGTYTAIAAVGLLRADYSIITHREVPITYRVAPALSVSQSSLEFRYVLGGPVPAAETVTVGGAGVAWTAAADQPWITMSGAAGTAPSTVQIGVDPAGLARGGYGGSVTFSKTAGGVPETVYVSLVVEEPELVETASVLSFSGVNGTAIPSQTLGISVTNGASVTWTAAVTPGWTEDWIVLSPSTGSTPGELVVNVDPARRPLPSGSHLTMVTVSATVNDGTRDVTYQHGIVVALDLTVPSLTVTPATLALGGTLGRDLSAREVQLTLGTGAVAHAWTATASDPWITLAPASGSVSASAATLAVAPAPSAAPSGTHQGTVSFSAAVNGDVVTAALPVTLALDEHRLLASDDGVAFASMPGLERLSRTLVIRDNFGAATPWTATTSAAWLTATAGTASGELVVAADPTGLAADTVHEATVTIASDGPGVAPETVRVGLWIGSATPPAIQTVSGAFRMVAVDPVRPYAYVHRGGPDIEVYNVFTGALVATFARVAPALGNLEISTDGSHLFATDETNLQIVPIDLPGGAKGTGWTVPYTPRTIVYARTNGRGVVFAGGVRAFDVTTGAVLDPAPLYLSTEAVADAAVDGTRACWAPTGWSGHDVNCHALDYTAVDGHLVVGVASIGSTFGYNGDLALNGDGTRVFHQDGVWNTATMTPVQTLPMRGRAFAVARDGRVLVATFAPYDPADLDVRDTQGFVLASYRVAGVGRTVLDAQLEVTGDGLCAALVTDDPMLAFLIVGP